VRGASLRRAPAAFWCAAVAAAGCARVPDMTSSALLGGCQRAVLVGAATGSATTVTWISPVDAGDRAELVDWCGTVGPALVAPSPARPTADRIDALALVTWNQHVGGGDLRGLVADLRAGALTEGVPVDHFVLLLQETYRTGPAVPADPPASAPIPGRIESSPGAGRPREDIRAVAGALGLAFFYAPSMRNGRESGGQPAEDRGNAILSTLPLHDFRVVTLPFERQRRATVTATARLPDGLGGHTDVGLSSLHLDVWPATVPSLLDGSRRIRQSSAFLAVLGGDSLPTVVGADLNALSSGDPHVELFRARWPGSEVPTSCRTRGLFCTDYLFAGGFTAWDVSPARVIVESYGSDHHPVVSLATRRVATAVRR